MKITLVRAFFDLDKDFYFPRFVNESLALEQLTTYIKKYHDTVAIDAVMEGWNNCWQNNSNSKTIYRGLELKQLVEKINLSASHERRTS